jgi:hypothetical protein
MAVRVPSRVVLGLFGSTLVAQAAAEAGRVSRRLAWMVLVAHGGARFSRPFASLSWFASRPVPSSPLSSAAKPIVLRPGGGFVRAWRDGG